MKHTPRDFHKYSIKQKEEFWLKNYEERRTIINESYISIITDDSGNLHKYKILEIILDLQDKIEDLANPHNYYD